MIKRIFCVSVSVLVLLTTAALSNRTPVFAAGSAAAAGYASQTISVRAIVGILNTERAMSGIKPLVLQKKQSLGTANCVGSLGHSQAMAGTGSIWHTNSKQSKASFPQDICVAYRAAGENVGSANSGVEAQDLISINSLMMSEAHDAATCASTINHACNILNKSFHHVGIGLVFANGTTWLTENFTN